MPLATICTNSDLLIATAKFTGNPRVTPEVTREVCLLARMIATDLYFARIEDLMFEVMNHCFFPQHDNFLLILPLSVSAFPNNVL